MPWTKKQKNLIRAIAHGFKPDQAMENVSQSKAKEWMGESSWDNTTVKHALKKKGGK